ncbi:MAG: hypothetical protein ACOYKI_01650 [Sediminibacterium sp.]
MKKSILTKILSLYIVMLCSISCNKKDQTIGINFQSTRKELLLNYLNQQKKVDLNSSSFIDTLISKSNWSDLSEKSISKDVTIIYVPLNYNRNRIGMTFLYNNNTQSIYYSLITETPLNLSSISPTKNPILNKPSDIILPKDAIRPIDVIAGFYKYNMNGYSGSIKAFSLSNSFLWEYGYQNGNRKYERLITNSNIEFVSNKTSPKQSYSVGSNKVKSSGCVWSYLVTYYNDGSQDWDLIGLKCDNGNDCQTTIGISEGSDIIKSDCSGKPNGPGGGSGNGDEFDKIINNITDECLKALLTNLQNANRLTNEIGGILQNVFGKNEKIILNFSQDDYLKDKKGEDAYGQSYIDLNGVYQTKLNARLLNNDFSEERQTATIMHEVLHDYFNYKMQEELKTYIPNQHTFMLGYINQMASSLEDLYPQLRQNPNLALSLAFNALESSVFRGDTKNLSLIEQSADGKIPPQLYIEAIERSVLNNISTCQALAIQAKGAKSNLGTKPCTTSNINNN